MIRCQFTVEQIVNGISACKINDGSYDDGGNYAPQ